VFTSTVVVPISHNEVTSASYTATTPGTYQWVADYSGDSNNMPITGSCGATGQSVLVTPPLNGFTPVGPVRVCDTRSSGAGVAANQCDTPGHSPMSSGSTLSITLAGTGGVPTDAVAVVLHVTVTGTTAASALTVWPAGDPRPTAASVTWGSGQTSGASVQVGVGSGGQISMYNYGGAADVVVDVTGYFDAGDGALFTASAPIRVCDTRPGTTTNQCNTGSGSGPIADNQSRAIDVIGGFGLPASTTAVVLNVTAVLPSTPSFLTIWPGRPVEGLPTRGRRPNTRAASLATGHHRRSPPEPSPIGTSHSEPPMQRGRNVAVISLDLNIRSRPTSAARIRQSVVGRRASVLSYDLFVWQERPGLRLERRR